jgi:GTP-binding protein EngB required for normal cell division
MAWPTSIQTELIVFKVEIDPWNFSLSAMSARKQTESIAQSLAFRGVNVGKSCLLKESYSKYC